MNEDWMQELEPRAGEELERIMGRYARVRLDPGPAQTRRARAAVMEHAWRKHLATPAAAAERAVVPARRRGPFSAWTGRRLGASVAAAVVAGLMIGSTTFAASRAGGPLYEARLTLEALTLPLDPTARLEAEIAQAQGRVAEIAEAASRGDGAGVDAAARAYTSSLAELDLASGEPAERALQAIRFHQTVLLQLLGTAPMQAIDGIERAIDRSSAVIDHLDSAAGEAPTTTPGGVGTGGGQAPGGGQGAGAAGGNGGNGGNGGGAAGGGNGGNGAGAGGDGDGATKPDPTRRPDRTSAPKPDDKSGGGSDSGSDAEPQSEPEATPVKGGDKAPGRR